MNFSYQPVANLKLDTIGLNIYRNGHGEYLMQDVVSFRLTEPMTQEVMQKVLGLLLSSDDEPLQFAPDPDETPGERLIAVQNTEPTERFAWNTKDASSNINFIKRMSNGDLYVTFKSGDTYVYYDVTQDVVDEWYDDWDDGGSIGGWFNRYIKGEYDSEKLPHEETLQPEE